MKFYSESNRPRTIPQPETSRIEPEYQERTDPKTGKKYLKKTGEVDVYAKIQESKESSLLKNILDRYKIDPKDSATKIDENIFDYTTQPANLMEALAIAEEAKEIYNQSSADIKQAFNNSYTEFLAGAVDGRLKKVIKETKNVVLDGQISIEEARKQEEIKGTSQIISSPTEPILPVKQETGGIKYE